MLQMVLARTKGDANSSFVSKVGTTAGYGVSIAVLALGSIVTIPALIAAGGAAAWAGIAVGQSIGAIGAMVINYGWSVTGPARIALVHEKLARSLYVQSMVSRVVVAAPVLLFGIGILQILDFDHGRELALGYVSAALIGLNANWFLVGRKSPKRMFLMDTLPRAVGLFGSALVAHLLGSIDIAMAVQIAGVVGSVLLPMLLLGRRDGKNERRAAFSRSVVANDLKVNFRPMTVNTSSTVFSALPIVVVGAAFANQLPVYAIADKLYRQISVGMAPVVNILQATVPSSDRERQIKKSRVALTMCVAFGLLLILIMAVAGPFLIETLGIKVDRSICILMGLLVAMTFLQMALQLAILPAFGNRATPLAPIVGGTLGVITILPMGALGGAQGSLIAVVLGLAVSVALLIRTYKIALSASGASAGGGHSAKHRR